MLLAQLPFAVFLGPALNIFTTFGEEWGWRGYLVPKTAARLRIVPTLLVTGVIWGLWHAPLTIIGHNYGVGYPGWPFAGIAAMCVFCIVLGIFLTYVTVRTGSCLAAAVGHGAINGFVSAGIMFSVTGGNPFVGPMPVGILGGSAFIVAAAFMLWDMHCREKAGTSLCRRRACPTT
ncbi:MAG: CPBP family intramembrane glutamic endopeptidase [Eggerthella lenta]